MSPYPLFLLVPGVPRTPLPAAASSPTGSAGHCRCPHLFPGDRCFLSSQPRRWQIFSRADQCGAAGCTICHLRARLCRVHGKGWGCETPKSLGGTPKHRISAEVGSRGWHRAGDAICRWKIPSLQQCQFVPNSPLGKKKITAALLSLQLCCHLPPLVSCFSGASGHQCSCKCQSGECLGSRGCGASQDLLHHCSAVHRSVQSCRAE